MSLNPTLKFEKLWKVTTTSDPIDMIENGRYVYVLTTSGVDVYEWWGATSGNEIAWSDHGKLEWASDGDKLVKVKTVTASGFKWILLGDNCLYLINNTVIKKLNFDISNILVVPTGTWSTDLTIDQHICNPCFIDGKIWFVRQPVGFYQYVDIVNIDDKSISTIDFPVKKQKVRADITFGYNDFVYITSWNTASILKYDLNTFSLISLIRVNANPYKLKVDPSNRRIYVASYGGMLSYIDADTDVVTHAHGTSQSYGDAPDIKLTDGMITDFDFDSRGYIWYVALKQLTAETPVLTGDFTSFDPNIASASLGKIDVNSNKHQFIPMYETDKLEKQLEDKDYFIKQEIIAPDKLLINIPFNYQYWDGSAIQTTTVSPYLFVIDDSKLWCCRLINELCRENKLDIVGHHMITQGPFDYTGDKA